MSRPPHNPPPSELHAKVETLEDLMKLEEVRKDDPLLWIDTDTAPTAGSISPCLLCGDPFLVPIYVGTLDQICIKCVKTFRTMPRLVCAQCNRVVGVIEPQKLENGFEVKRNAVLHMTTCGHCTPGLRKSHIIEIYNWEREHRTGQIWVPVNHLNKDT